jgi:hypothetical protein
MSTPPYLVTFNFDQFALEYPEFATVDPVRAQSMFNIAQLSILDNTSRRSPSCSTCSSPTC